MHHPGHAPTGSQTPLQATPTASPTTSSPTIPLCWTDNTPTGPTTPPPVLLDSWSSTSDSPQLGLRRTLSDQRRNANGPTAPSPQSTTRPPPDRIHHPGPSTHPYRTAAPQQIPDQRYPSTGPTTPLHYILYFCRLTCHAPQSAILSYWEGPRGLDHGIREVNGEEQWRGKAAVAQRCCGRAWFEADDAAGGPWARLRAW
jgi:hypothetical protein